jgi:hypothetical protein
MKLTSIIAFVTCPNAAHAVSEQDPSLSNEVVEIITHDFRGRQLKYARNKIAWPKCVTEGMTVDECHALIEKEI